MEKQRIVINNDNDMLSKWANEQAKNTQIEIHTFGINNSSEIMAKDIKREENSSTFVAESIDEKQIKLTVPVGGDVFILNALCATLVGKILDLTEEEISRGIKTFELTKKRMEIIKKNGITIINDSYNASLDSMKASLQYLAQTNSKRKIAVLGDMFELGSFSEKLHREVGKEVAKNKIDILIVIGDDAIYILEEAQKQDIKTIYAKTKEELLQTIKQNQKTGDAILFKASNGMKLFEVVEEIKND